MKRIRGSMAEVPTIEVGKTTVRVRTNIVRIEEEDFSGWEYDEEQYTVREYAEKTGYDVLMQEDYLIDTDFRLSMIELGVGE